MSRGDLTDPHRIALSKVAGPSRRAAPLVLAGQLNPDDVATELARLAGQHAPPLIEVAGVLLGWCRPEREDYEQQRLRAELIAEAARRCPHDLDSLIGYWRGISAGRAAQRGR